MNIPSLRHCLSKSVSIFRIMLTLTGILSLSSCGVESDRFKLSGRFLNMNQGEFYVYSHEGGIDGIDTIQVQGGRFTLERPMEREATLMLVFPNFSEQPVFAQPGKSVEIKADASHMKEMEVTGTKANELMTKFRKQTANSSPPDVKEKAIQFVNEHPESPVGLFLVKKYFLQIQNPDYAKAADMVRKMHEKQPKNGELMVLQKQLNQLKNTVKGKALPTFTTRDMKGNTVSDKDLGNDVAVVCVWSSWNYESQEMQRQLKKRQRKYGSRLKVMSISIDADKKSCERIIDRDTISWPNIFDGKLFEGPTLKTLGLSAVPDNLVIQHRRIVARSLSTKDLYDKVDELLK